MDHGAARRSTRRRAERWGWDHRGRFASMALFVITAAAAPPAPPDAATAPGPAT